MTDYTRNEILPPIDTAWSDPSLTGGILKIEMWDRAAEAAAQMQSGEYYALKNVRMRMSNGGYVEGKMSEPKIRKLDADELEGQPHLVELLKWVYPHHNRVDTLRSQFIGERVNGKNHLQKRAGEGGLRISCSKMLSWTNISTAPLWYAISFHLDSHMTVIFISYK